jgi:hypothetical protein
MEHGWIGPLTQTQIKVLCRYSAQFYVANQHATCTMDIRIAPNVSTSLYLCNCMKNEDHGFAIHFPLPQTTVFANFID